MALAALVPLEEHAHYNYYNQSFTNMEPDSLLLTALTLLALSSNPLIRILDLYVIILQVCNLITTYPT